MTKCIVSSINLHFLSITCFYRNYVPLKNFYLEKIALKALQCLHFLTIFSWNLYQQDLEQVQQSVPMRFFTGEMLLNNRNSKENSITTNLATTNPSGYLLSLKNLYIFFYTVFGQTNYVDDRCQWNSFINCRSDRFYMT